MDFEAIAEIFSEIESYSSTIIKKEILRENADVPGFKDVLKFIYDPSFTTGLKANKLQRAVLSQYQDVLTASEMMEYLLANNTGTNEDAAVALNFIVEQETENAAWLAEGLVTKDLQIGISVTTLNSVFGKQFIPIIGIMRGRTCPPEISGRHILTEKIDGNRRLIFTTEAGPRIFTRSGKPDYGLVDILRDARKLPLGYVFDTEITADGQYANSLELRIATSSLASRVKSQRTGLTANCFDMIPIEEYNRGKGTTMGIIRKLQLGYLLYDEDILAQTKEIVRKAYPAETRERMFNAVMQATQKYRYFPDVTNTYTPSIRALPIISIVSSYEEALRDTQPIWDAGGEGSMLLKDNSVYVVSKSTQPTLLKVKATEEHVLEVVDVLEGTNKYEGMLGAAAVRYFNKDGYPFTVKVGSGFSDWQRVAYWANPELLIGKKIEIDSFGETYNQAGGYSLNCPIFKRIVEEDE